MPHAQHGFTHTHIEHHSDNSHTVHHVHKDGDKHDVKHAVQDLDGVHDSLQANLGQPNPGEAAPSDAGAPMGAPPPSPLPGA